MKHKNKIYKSEVFNNSDMLFLNILSRHETIKTYKIIKKYSSVISKASASRTIKKLIRLKIIIPTKSINYMSIHKRIVSKNDLGIIPIPSIEYECFGYALETIN